MDCNYSAIEKEIILFASKYLQLEALMQSEISWTQTDRYKMFYLYMQAKLETI